MAYLKPIFYSDAAASHLLTVSPVRRVNVYQNDFGAYFFGTAHANLRDNVIDQEYRVRRGRPALYRIVVRAKK